MDDNEIILTPEQARALTAFLRSQTRRLNTLYHILDKDGQLQRFAMNWAQERLHQSAHTRNNILKVRQLGISTYLSMLMLDSCLFTPNFKAGIVDKTIKLAKNKLKKIKFAYDMLDHLPENPTAKDRELAEIGRMLKQHFHKPSFNKEEITFPNGSSISVGTTVRGDTLQLLHVSELGSIAAHDPLIADEVVTGSINAVGMNSRVYLESTHEGGRYGVNYELILAAMDMIGKPLSPLDFKFYFFDWMSQAEYQLPQVNYQPSPKHEDYFNGLERRLDITITPAQRAWYTTMERTQRAKMKQEYPSVPEEALSPIMDGTIYIDQIGLLRERGHLAAEFEHDRYRPIFTAWDIGVGDYTAIWWIQPMGNGKLSLLDCYTACNKDVAHYINIVREKDVLYGRCTCCITPHDGAKRDITLTSYDDHLRKAGYNVTGVPRTSNIWDSIENTRALLPSCIIHKRCSEPTICDSKSFMPGVDALANYRTLPAGSNGSLKTAPLHDLCSHAADALRTFADGLARGLISLHTPQAQDYAPSQSSYVQDFLS